MIADTLELVSLWTTQSGEVYKHSSVMRKHSSVRANSIRRRRRRGTRKWGEEDGQGGRSGTHEWQMDVSWTAWWQWHRQPAGRRRTAMWTVFEGVREEGTNCVSVLWPRNCLIILPSPYVNGKATFNILKACFAHKRGRMVCLPPTDSALWNLLEGSSDRVCLFLYTDYVHTLPRGINI